MPLPALPHALDLWLPAWLRRREEGLSPLGARHLVLAVCDHYEPFDQGASPAQAMAGLDHWTSGLRALGEEFRDSGGGAPRHTFFYPIEQYHADVVRHLAGLCQATGSETEIGLHHDRDTAEHLRTMLLVAKERLAGHGLLARDELGEVRYGFIHGEGALDNSHPAGHHCGVAGELGVLRDTGCFADFTLPSAPRRTQTALINSLYYARSTALPMSHARGRRVRADRTPDLAARDELLIVQGPLALDWEQRHWGLLPGVENSELSARHPPTATRLRVWLDCRISVGGRPGWTFVKLHTRGARPENTRALLGEPMRRFHRALTRYAQQDASFRYHYVTAREMVNLIHAAEAGHSGDPARFRNFRYQRCGASPP